MEDTQTRANIHLSSSLSDGKGEDDTSDTQTRSNIHISNKGGEGIGENRENDADGRHTQDTKGDDPQGKIEIDEKEQVQSDDNVISSGRSTSSLKFAREEQSETRNEGGQEASSQAPSARTAFEEQSNTEAKFASSNEATRGEALATELTDEATVDEVIEETKEEPKEETKEEPVEEVVVNSAPTTNATSILVDEDNAHNFSADDFSFGDVDGDSLHHVTITELPENGMLTLNGELVVAGEDIAASEIEGMIFTPENNANGDDYGNFKFTVNDGELDSAEQDFNIDVTAVNDAPIIESVELQEFTSSLSLNEESATGDYAALSGLDDFPTEALTIQISFTSDQPPVSSETNGISLVSYATSGSNNEFLLFAEPGGSVSAYINGQRTPLNVGSNDLFDGESHDLAVSWDSASGEVSIYVDGNLTDTAMTGVGQPLTTGGTLILGQEQDNVGGGFQSNQEFSGEFHSIEVFSEVRTAEEIAGDVGVLPEGGESSLVLGFDFSSDEPLNNMAGDEVFILDGGATITNLEDGVVEEDSIGISGQVIAGDLDGDDLSFTVSDDPSEGSVTIEADGSFHFNPGDDFQDLSVGESRDVSFEIEVSDGQGGADTQTVTITVTGQNDGPVAESLDVQISEDNSFDGQLVATDIEGDNLSFSLNEQPTEGAVTINADGSFSFSPENDFQDLGVGESRETSFSYEVNDNNGGTAIETVTVTVTGTNDAPVIGQMTNVVGSLDEVETVAGMAMSFNEDGPTGDVAMVDNMTEFPTEALTVELNFSSTEVPQAASTNGISLFSYNAAGGENEFLLFTEPSGSLGVYINGQRTAMDADMNSLFDGEYHHLAVSWDSETGELAVYVDGNLADTATAQAGRPIKSGGTMALGQEQDGVGGGFASNQQFSGKIADVQIFDEARDADLIEQDAANGGTAVDDSSLVHAYDFSQSDGNSVIDQGASNDMEFNGSVIVEDAELVREVGEVELVVEEDGGAVSGTLTASDVEGDNISFSLVDAPGEGSVTIDADGNFEFDPGADFQDLEAGETREVSFTYQADDGNGGVETATETVTVMGTNDGPIAAPDGKVTDFEDVSFSGSWGRVDEGVDGWQTDNDGDKIEVGYETTYGGSDGSNVIVELEANKGDQSNLYKDFATNPGETIEISFDYSARGGRGGDDSAVEVYWDGKLIDTITPSDSFGWENHSYEVTADGDSGRLEFQATDTNSLGGLLDNIEVSVSDDPVEAGGLVVEGSVGAEDIVGGSGDDTLMFNADSTWAGYSAHNVETGETVGIGGSNRSSDVFDGGDGYDTIEGTSGDDTLFMDDSISDFASDKQARIQDVEEINMGDGDDVVDMTSSTYTYDQGITVDGGDGNDTIWTSTGDDQINGGAGDDSMYGGDGNDTLTFLAHQGNDVVDGGSGGSWTDTLELGGFDGQGNQEGWTLSLNDGSTVESTDDLSGEMVLSGDAGGTITFDDGGSLDFENIEKIVW